MGLHCIGSESNKCKTYIKKYAEARDFIEIACCQEYGVVRLHDIPSEQDLLEFYVSKYRFEYRRQEKPGTKQFYGAGAMAVYWLKKIRIIFDP